jgi:transcriptional regulator with XRE-family HTH domain
MPGSIFGSRDRAAMQPEEVRALRDELGWTQEQLAGAVGVSPLELSAWEAGVVAIPPDSEWVLARMAWRQRLERAWEAADARPCDMGASLRTDYLRQKHQARCALCQPAVEVERAFPPPPAPPDSFPLSGSPKTLFYRTLFIGELLPAPLRAPAALAVGGGWLALLTLLLALARFVVQPSAGFDPSPALALQVIAIFGGWLVAGVLWSEVYPERTFRADLFKAVTTAVLVVAMTLWGLDPLEQAGMGFLALFIVPPLCKLLGLTKARAQPTDQNALAATDAGSGALPAPCVEPPMERMQREPVPAGSSAP